MPFGVAQDVVRSARCSPIVFAVFNGGLAEWSATDAHTQSKRECGEGTTTMDEVMTKKNESAPTDNTERLYTTTDNGR